MNLLKFWHSNKKKTQCSRLSQTMLMHGVAKYLPKDFMKICFKKHCPISSSPFIPSLPFSRLWLKKLKNRLILSMQCFVWCSNNFMFTRSNVNPFQANLFYSSPLKTSKNIFSHIFRWDKKGTLVWNRLKCFDTKFFQKIYRTMENL